MTGNAQPPFSLGDLFETLKSRKRDIPEDSYSASLFKDRKLLLNKILEEANEVICFKSQENLCWEIADLVYFLSVLAVDEGLSWKNIELELGRRHDKKS